MTSAESLSNEHVSTALVGVRIDSDFLLTRHNDLFAALTHRYFLLISEKV